MTYTISTVEYVNNGLGWEQSELIPTERESVSSKEAAQAWADKRGAAEGRRYQAYEGDLCCGESRMGQSQIVWAW